MLLGYLFVYLTLNFNHLSMVMEGIFSVFGGGR